MLWACLYFPQLPVDRQAVNVNSAQPIAAQPFAVIHQQGARKLVMACNDAATARGVHAALALNSAYAVAPDLLVSDYVEQEQHEHLQQLALWALQFSSWVTPRMPSCILLEIQASLKLFGGLDALLDNIRNSASEQGLTLRTAVAPTSATATLLAHAGYHSPVRTTKQMQSVLAGIEVDYLPVDEFTLRGLRQSGIRTLQQLKSLTPAALTRRFGHQCTDILYKLDGTLPDPCPAFNAPETFSQALDLNLDAPDTQALAFPLNRLLGALGGYLKAGDLGVKQLSINLYHYKYPPTQVDLRFLDATANHEHLLKIARERLANTPVPEPIRRLKIHASELAAIERDGKDLFQKSQAQSSSIEQVFDNLLARLGKNAIYTAMPGDDHRPEKAWMATLLENRQTPEQWPARPLWLLATPQPVSEKLQIQTSAERIENGWWGETDVRRDYFIARNRHGSYFWVFHMRQQPDKYFIHGIFS